MNAVDIKDLSFAYNQNYVLENITLEVKKGSKLAILGPNGAGKTTLILHMNGILKPKRGVVRIFGEVPERKEVRKRVGIVFQDPDDQVFLKTVFEDVAFGLFNLGMNSVQVEGLVFKILEELGIGDLKDRNTFKLSYGQKKKVALAGVLVMEPDIIILDEPTAFLDPSGQDDMLRIIDDLNRKGKTIIMTTHDIDLAAEWADEVVILKKGRIVAAGEKKMLTDKRLMQETGLRLPKISELFYTFCSEDRLPMTLQEGIKTIKEMLER